MEEQGKKKRKWQILDDGDEWLESICGKGIECSFRPSRPFFNLTKLRKRNSDFDSISFRLTNHTIKA